MDKMHKLYIRPTYSPHISLFISMNTQPSQQSKFSNSAQQFLHQFPSPYKFKGQQAQLARTKGTGLSSSSQPFSLSLINSLILKPN